MKASLRSNYIVGWCPDVEQVMGEGGKEEHYSAVEQQPHHRSAGHSTCWEGARQWDGNSFLPSSPLATELPTDLVLSLNSSPSVFNP